VLAARTDLRATGASVAPEGQVAPFINGGDDVPYRDRSFVLENRSHVGKVDTVLAEIASRLELVPFEASGFRVEYMHNRTRLPRGVRHATAESVSR
jgi:hypothetical protein